MPIPIEETKYLKEFSKDEIEDYKSLVSKSQRHFVIENLPGLSKPELYRNGGKFVADSSIILIALYEGADNFKKGGTADIVHYKTHGTFNEDIENNIFDLNGSIISIQCNRLSAKKSDISFDNNLLNKLLQDVSIKKALEKIELFNKKISKIKPKELRISAAYLYPNDKKLIEPNQTLKHYYSLIDTLAINQQKRYNVLLLSFFVIGLIFIATFESYKHLGLSESLYYFSVVLIVFTYGIYIITHKWSNHTKYIDNRILAEALRIQFFWNISDINSAVANHILRIHKTEFIWIKHILLSIYGLTYNAEKTRDETLFEVKKYWIENQKEFFNNRLNKLSKNKKKFDYYSRVFFVLGLVSLISIGVLHFYIPEFHLLHPLIVINSVFLGMFALTKTYYEKKGYNQIHNQYSLMESIYETTLRKMDEIDKNISINKEKQLDRLLFLAGIEALVENGNWYLVYKEKEPEIEGIGG